MGLFTRGDRAPTIRVHVLIRGRIGDGWHDLDEHLKLPVGVTLGQLLDHPAAAKLPLKQALAASPHLAETIMLNGERTPIAEHADRMLADGDELYLLAPIAGG